MREPKVGDILSLKGYSSYRFRVIRSSSESITVEQLPDGRRYEWARELLYAPPAVQIELGSLLDDDDDAEGR